MTNAAPVAGGGSRTTIENASVTFPSGDTDPEGDPLTDIIVIPPAHGSLSLGDDGNFTYTPDTDYKGPDSFTHKANDGLTDGNTATVSLTVQHVNLPPVLTVPETQHTLADVPLSIVVSADDLDAGSEQLELSWSVSNGTLTLGSVAGLTFSSGDGTADASGTATGTLTELNASLGGAIFTPTANFIGAAYVTVIVDDLGNTGIGGPKYDIEGVFIVVGPDLQAVDDAATTRENKPTDVEVLDNDL